ncbi:MAG TPA: RIP metalloprotease RseP [Casimicrobiaceae bacterium]|jgi:regulator of sigma E protease|nr:RIP metalloprotease RseP [Casimicrobiaceae bacterium]
MDVLTKLLAFAVTLGVLVVFHELGHYLVARWCGVKVTRFSVGFGRVVWSRRSSPDGTEWALSAVPLGGYVKMADEREGEVAAKDLPHAFNRQSVWRRIAIVAAGPIANLLLAVLLFAGTYVAGVPGQRAIVATPPAGTAAAATALREGDLVTAVDGVAVRSWQDLRWRLLRASGEDAVELTLQRDDGSTTRTPLALSAVPSADWEGNFMSVLGLKADFGPPLIDEAVPDKPAARAGLKAGDRIVAIDGAAVRSPADVAAQTNAKPGATVVFRVDRGGEVFDTEFVTEVGERGGRRIGLAGVRLKVDPARADRLAVTVRYGPFEALGAGLRKTAELSVFTLRMLGRIVIGEASVRNISGPITMADFAGQSAQAGGLVFVGYLALISISLGVLNLLPVPLLDGGHLLYYFAEIVKGSPVSDRAFEVGQRIGMAVLAMLMTLALFNDLTRLF